MERSTRYQSGVFLKGLGYKDWDKLEPGFVYHRDNTSKATYSYNKEKEYFFTFDDSLSVTHKTEYVKRKGLKGIMFWQLMNDSHKNDLLSAMVKAAASE